MLYSEAWGKMIHEKKPEAKNLVTLPLKRNKTDSDKLRRNIFF
jgi:hypothetical protein